MSHRPVRERSPSGIPGLRKFDILLKTLNSSFARVIHLSKKRKLSSLIFATIFLLNSFYFLFLKRKLEFLTMGMAHFWITCFLKVQEKVVLKLKIT